MQIQRDRLLQTAAYDKSARTLTLNEEDFGKAFVSMLMRNIGHCLGLTDNLAGSAAYSLCVLPVSQKKKASAHR